MTKTSIVRPQAKVRSEPMLVAPFQHTCCSLIVESRPRCLAMSQEVHHAWSTRLSYLVRRLQDKPRVRRGSVALTVTRTLLASVVSKFQA